MLFLIQPDDTHVVAGMSNGFLSVKYRLKKDAEDQVPTSRKLTAGTYHYFVRGKNFRPQEVSVLFYYIFVFISL